METKGNKLIATKNKVLRRISDGNIVGDEIYLGYTYYLHGEILAEPLLELAQHYEEIDEPVTEKTVVLTADKPLVEEYSDTDSQREFRKVTVGDYLKLKDELQQIKQLLGLNK